MTDLQITQGLYPSSLLMHALVLFAGRHLPDGANATIHTIGAAVNEAPTHIKTLGLAILHALDELHTIDQENPKGENPIGQDQARKLYQELPDSILAGPIQDIVSIAITTYAQQHHPDLYNDIINHTIAQELNLKPKTVNAPDSPTLKRVQHASQRVTHAVNHFKTITGIDP